MTGRMRSVRLLKNCRGSMQGAGRAICADAVLPPIGNTAGTPAKLMDINMLTFVPGRERTEAQWNDMYRMYRADGFEIPSIIPIHDNLGTSIVEGVRARM